MHVIWHGHSFVEIEKDNGSILIDPYISGNGLCDISVQDVTKKNILGIALTHGHSDHVGNSVDIAKQTGCAIICEYGLAQYLETEGVKTVRGSIGGSVSLGTDIIVQFFTAVHGGGIIDNANPYKCAPAGLLLTIDGKKLYHAGDTGLTYDMKILGELYEVDTAFLPIGGTFTMGIADAVHAVKFISPKMAIPIHYNTWDTIKADPTDFARLVMQETSTVPKVLTPGQYIVQ